MKENERVKYLRKDLLHLTQTEFGKRLGVTKVAISKIEVGARGVTDQMLISICREYGVNKEWLRDGKGKPFVEKTEEEELQELAEKIMSDAPESFRRRFVSALARLTDEQWEVLSEIEDLILDQIEKKDTTAAAEADYIKKISASARSGGSTVSNITKDAG